MSTYKEKLDYTEETKNLIKTAIANKGVAVGEGDTFRSYAEKIDSIPAARPMGLIKIKTYDTWQPSGFIANIEKIDWTDFNKARVTSVAEMFNNWPYKTIDIANLSTIGVTNMYYMFNGCANLTSLDVSHFDTSKVTNMHNMFQYCRILPLIKGLENFDTSEVTNMHNMFYYCENLTSLDVSHFDTSKVTDMYQMFSNCANLTSLDVSHFDTSKVTDMHRIFNGCKSLTTVTFGNNWASNPKVTEFDLSGPSYNPMKNLTHETILDLFNKLAIRDNTPVLKLAGITYDACTSEELKIAQDKGWTVTRV